MAGDISMEDVKKSGINGGVLKTLRIHDSLSHISSINNNLLAYNIEAGEFNYILKKNSIDTLYAEVESKCTDEERKEIEDMQNAIEKFLEDYPIYNKRSDLGRKNSLKLNIINWKVFKKYLNEYDLRVRRLHDIHGLDTYYADEEDEY